MTRQTVAANQKFPYAFSTLDILNYLCWVLIQIRMS